MTVHYDRDKENWWLSVGNSVVGDVHRSLTNKLLRDRWLACQVLESARVSAEVSGHPWMPQKVAIRNNGETQAEDLI